MTGRDRIRGGPTVERDAERELVLFVHGELAADRAEEIRRRMEREPALAERVRRLDAAWNGLELPPAEPPPPGFASRVAARALAQDRDEAEAAAFRPAWVRAVAAAALTVGIGAGAALGWLAPSDLFREDAAIAAAAGGGTGTVAKDALSVDAVPTLAESYWSDWSGVAVDPQDGVAAEEAR